MCDFSIYFQLITNLPATGGRYDGEAARPLSGQTRSLSAPPFGRCGGDEPLTAEEEGGDRGGRVSYVLSTACTLIQYQVLRCIKDTALQIDIQ